MDISYSKTKLEYRPLVSITAIRLVVIQAGSGREPIRCHLIHTELGEMAYEALSYEWKEESDDDPIINVNSVDITVRKNLHDALVEIRLPEAERYIWIDALSINQSKVDERNAQIKIMGQIYSGALKVIVWLGGAAGNSDTAFKMLENIAAQTVLRTADRMSDEEYYNQLGQLSEGFSHEDWKALVDLCQRPYWSRIWVLQEVHLAKSYEVRCGDKSISGSDFQNSIVLFSGGIIETGISAKYCNFLSESAVAVHRMAKDISPQANTLRRWIIVTSSRGFISTNPHDMIYALLGVSSDWQDGKVILIPNYAKPLPDLFFDIVRIIRTRPPGYSAIKALRSLAGRFECTTDARVKKFLEDLETAD